jgi:hypothetical protein
MSPTDKEYLEKVRNYATQVRTLLSSNNKMKSERERSVCRAFLRTLEVSFQDSELIAPTHEPVDVAFRKARFQVKDKIDHLRGDFWKQIQRKYETAASIDEAIDTDAPPTPIPVGLNALIPEITAELSQYADQYGITCKDLDILIYVDERKRFLASDSTVSNVEPLKAQGWRSVSLLFPPFAVVLFAKPEAPDFLKAAEAKLYAKWFDMW